MLLKVVATGEVGAECGSQREGKEGSIYFWVAFQMGELTRQRLPRMRGPRTADRRF